MAGFPYAIVKILCDPAIFPELDSIPNLVVQEYPRYTSDPKVMVVNATADAAAQAAAMALGATVTVLQTGDEYAAKLTALYGALNDGGGVA